VPPILASKVAATPTTGLLFGVGRATHPDFTSPQDLNPSVNSSVIDGNGAATSKSRDSSTRLADMPPTVGFSTDSDPPSVDTSAHSSRPTAESLRPVVLTRDSTAVNVVDKAVSPGLGSVLNELTAVAPSVSESNAMP